jgi:7-keto-8-aminopelargonate synthetase-like enzyme
MDVFEKCFRFTAAKDAMKAGQYPYFTPMTENEGTTVESHGHKLIMCGSNNYLGLTTHPEVREAAMKAIERFGSSCTGSRFLNGTLELHEELESELATWVGKPAALVFSTGMLVNLGTVSALVGREDVVILDKEVHASIVDGCKLSGAEFAVFRHSDMDDLERLLQRSGGRRTLVVVGLATHAYLRYTEARYIWEYHQQVPTAIAGEVEGSSLKLYRDHLRELNEKWTEEHRGGTKTFDADSR